MKQIIHLLLIYRPAYLVLVLMSRPQIKQLLSPKQIWILLD